MTRAEVREHNEAEARPILGDTFERTIGLATAFAHAVDVKGDYHPSHSQGVEQIARSVAEHMGWFEPPHVARIAMAGLLHDLGKLMVPDRVLLGSGRLVGLDLAVMRRHAVDGEMMMLAAGFGVESYWVRCHHERWDGTGYPNGLTGVQIPIEARIIGVADAFHAMQSHRPYQEPRSMAWAMDELERCVGSQFCPLTVAAVQDMDKAR
jgi:HD-GYP domain-containing protein (c-di-GMP phosphodiesterase class II)